MFLKDTHVIKKHPAGFNFTLIELLIFRFENFTRDATFYLIRPFMVAFLFLNIVANSVRGESINKLWKTLRKKTFQISFPI